MKNNFKKNKESLLYVPESCPVCAKRYNGSKVNILKNDLSEMMVHITCENCLSSIISNISFNNVRIMAVGILTDLTKEDLHLIKNKKYITSDDVIDLHEYIEKEGCIKFKESL
jgi:hypothetical protein